MGVLRPESVKWAQKAQKPAKMIRAEPNFRRFLLESATHARFCRVFPQPLNVCFIHHRESKDRDDGALKEAMKMVVSTDPDHWVYQKVIPFDHQEFQRLVQIPDKKAHRRMDLVEMAKAVLGDLLP